MNFLKKTKILFLVIVGNIIDYYDFLLFAHLGSMITPVFIGGLDTKKAHLVSLLLFALPFFIRPIGGYIFGKIADINGQKEVLVKSLKYSSFSTLGIALLPGCQYLGVFSAVLFVILRAVQGLSLGGEYPTAGTYLMNENKDNQGLFSGILTASGTIGSLLGFFVYFLYIKSYISGQDWRYAFAIAYLGTFLTLKMRQVLTNSFMLSEEKAEAHDPYLHKKCFLIFLLAAFMGTIYASCTVYTNYYFTKILGFSLYFGLQSTLVALVTYVFFCVILGRIADCYNMCKIMMVFAILMLPLSVIGDSLIRNGMIVGQIFLALSAALGAPFHAFMNKILPKKNRSRNLNVSFMSGSAVAGFIPFLSGYLIEKYDFHSTFTITFIVLSFVTVVFLFFNKSFYKSLY